MTEDEIKNITTLLVEYMKDKDRQKIVEDTRNKLDDLGYYSLTVHQRNELIEEAMKIAGIKSFS